MNSDAGSACDERVSRSCTIALHVVVVVVVVVVAVLAIEPDVCGSVWMIAVVAVVVVELNVGIAVVSMEFFEAAGDTREVARVEALEAVDVVAQLAHDVLNDLDGLHLDGDFGHRFGEQREMALDAVEATPQMT